ncbi:DNA-binding MurR/RpiR family transcriptional regulator [Bacillus ectoiniformans]|uniref:MurR/RpiR family transcriptional regulator n=1 Tax=Bacillus ectoiniformans TaxID=1494429 RepID=UPI00195955DD|nr:MurR/RpiR family transcriptional regulator [Bacillus ectoiniformans]MBM7649119.1 DNA-binding MurR/RpiR family transcriptional regulator [Bacillus ectoiniformans]
MSNNVYRLIAGKMGGMSKSQEKIAKFILENQHTAPFLTVEKLSKQAEVSQATVVRFATFLGYSGYPELQQYMQSSVQQQLTTTERLKISKEMYDEKETGVYAIFQDDMDNLKSTMETLDMEAFHQAVDCLLKARKVYIIANRSALSLGVFLHYYLQMMLDEVELISSIETTAERLYNLGEEDAVIALSFARYTKSTIDIFAYAKEQKATAIAITDTLLSPLIPHADITLTASSRMPTFIDSFVAPLSVINALITYLGKEKEDNLKDRLDSLEDLWDRLDTFYK